PKVPSAIDWHVCLQCGTEFRIALSEIPESGQAQIPVSEVRLPTYEREYVRVIPGRPARVAVVGRLDLFAAGALEKAWRTIPPPRRAVIDLRRAAEFTGPGVATVVRLRALVRS